MYINHNQMAGNVANTLTSHYSNLATSTQRLSSGLRVNSAADDAAGLAIRELMRADISALQQGVRNANDAISLIQTADGALGIIDEKLIRMKELAEQAATGTYDSTQRLMIESEYQAMASEITRIANATDFNGIKLLDGSLEGTHDGSGLESTGQLKVHFGSGNNSAEDYYYIGVGEMTAAALGVGNASTWEDVAGRAEKAYVQAMKDEINNTEKYKNLTDAQRGEMLAQVEASGQALKNALINATDFETAYDLYAATDAAGAVDPGFLEAGKTSMAGNSTLMNEFLVAGKRQTDAVAGATVVNATYDEVKNIMSKVQAAIDPMLKELKNSDVSDGQTTPAIDSTKETEKLNAIAAKAKEALLAAGLLEADATTASNAISTALSGNPTYDDWADDVRDAAAELFKWDAAGTAREDPTLSAAVETGVINKNKTAISDFEAGLRETEKEKLRYEFGQMAMYNLAHGSDVPEQYDPDGNGDIDNFPGFGISASAGLNFSVADPNNAGSDLPEVDAIRKAALGVAYDKVKDMDFAGHTIETQEDAQQALEALDKAIVQKDKTRAHLGALQNRLENTVSNLTTQSENLQAAESRISDVDVATEMTQFVRNQILTQSAVAMLSQANSMPQMAMQLIH